METIKRFLANPIVSGVLGLLVGIFIGLIILGWWLIPVKCPECGGLLVIADKRNAQCLNCQSTFPLDEVVTEEMAEANR